MQRQVAPSRGPRNRPVEIRRRACLNVGVTELELAAACAKNDRAALSTLQKEYLPRALETLRVTDSDRAEISALVLERLLVREDGGAPRISQFSGKGPLVAWLRMIASRVAIDLQRKAPPHTGLEG